MQLCFCSRQKHKAAEWAPCTAVGLPAAGSPGGLANLGLRGCLVQVGGHGKLLFVFKPSK